MQDTGPERRVDPARTPTSVDPRIDTSPGTGSAGTECARAVWRVEEVPSVRGISPDLNGKHVAVLGVGQAEAEALRAVLQAHGAHVTRVPPVAAEHVHHVAAPADNPEWLRKLLVPQGRAVDGVVDLGVGALEFSDASASWARQYRQTRQALALLAPRWSTSSDMRRHFYAPILRTGGDFGTLAPPQHPHGGLWAGLAKGLPYESPNVNLRILDFPAYVEPHRLADRVAAELYRWGLYEVGWVNGHRLTPVARTEPAPEPTLRLGQGDTVLVTGGARGPGYALARRLAAEFDCPVVVTGRHRLEPDDPLWRLDDQEWRHFLDDRLRHAERSGAVRGVRRRLRVLARDREVARNLRLAHEQGAPLTYVTCDVTDPDQVERVVRDVGESLALVVHATHPTAPSRPGETGPEPGPEPEAVAATATGLLNLLAAVDRYADPSVVSVIGPLAGRRGASVGGPDHGAAAEAASYLARWSVDMVPVRTAVQFVAFPGRLEPDPAADDGSTTVAGAGCALSDSEIVTLWLGELLAASEGEITFCDRLDRPATPALALGYSARGDLPGTTLLRSVVARSGEPVRYRAGEELTTRVDLAPPGDPVNLDLTVNGEAGVPVSVVVDQMTSTASWLVAGQALKPVGLLDLNVDLTRLTDATVLLCVVNAAVLGTSDDDLGGNREVLVGVDIECGEHTLASATVRFAGSYPRPGHPEVIADRIWRLAGSHVHRGATAPTPGVRLDWAGVAFDFAAVSTAWPSGSAEAEEAAATVYRIGPDRLADQFVPGLAPVPTFGYNLVEGLAAHTYSRFHGVPHRDGDDGLVHRFAIEELSALRPLPRDEAVFARSLGTTGPTRDVGWWVSDVLGTPVLQAVGVAFTALPEERPRTTPQKAPSACPCVSPTPTTPSPPMTGPQPERDDG